MGLKPRAVIVYPTADYNRAFDRTPEELLKQGYDVKFYRAGSEAEALQDVVAATRDEKADVLILGGHGNTTSLWFGEPGAGHDDESSLDVDDAASLAAFGACVSDKGIIALDSCSVGAGHEAATNLANALHAVAPHTLLFAPDSLTGADSTFQVDTFGRLVQPIYTMGARIYAQSPLVAAWVSSLQGSTVGQAKGTRIVEALSGPSKTIGRSLSTLIPPTAVLVDVNTIPLADAHPPQRQYIESFDVDRDGVVDFVRNTTLELASNTVLGCTVTQANVPPEQRTIWWADDQDGQIYWVQRGNATSFENVIDRNRDGVVDFVAKADGQSGTQLRDDDFDGVVDATQGLP